jgi:16S rRNA C1402 N4-methylase RsmH
VPGKEEIERNPPSRSARLRVVEKVLDEDGQ